MDTGPVPSTIVWAFLKLVPTARPMVAMSPRAVASVEELRALTAVSRALTDVVTMPSAAMTVFASRACMIFFKGALRPMDAKARVRRVVVMCVFIIIIRWRK